jgi:hypothetical protein
LLSPTTRLWTAFFALVFVLLVSTHGITLAETKEEARWSINFGDISISEALDQLSKVTGIKIFTKTPLSHRISHKRYRNQSIEQILKDLLKNVNFAAVYHYRESGIESIGILAFDRERAESRSMVSNVKKIGTIRHPLPRGAGPTRLPPSRQMSGSERDEGIKEPLDEPEEIEGSEGDDRDEELEKSSTEHASSPDSSDAQLEPATGSSSGEEDLPKDQQNEGKQ